jgi:hypothetical protein
MGYPDNWPKYRTGQLAETWHRVKGKAKDGRGIEGMVVSACAEVGKGKNIKVKQADGSAEYHDAADFELVEAMTPP